MGSTWDPLVLPPQHGRTFAVTGATSGIGYFVAEQFAGTGADVVLLGRDADRLTTAQREIRRRRPSASVRTVELDLADLASVTRTADALAALDRLDVLVANAGLVSAGVRRRTTRQGFELTVGTNFLGHFVLTTRLLPILAATPGSRVVSMGSHLTRRIPFDRTNLLGERTYRPRVAYAQSKHAVEMFGFELDRRLRRAGSPVSSLVAHPGSAIDAVTPRRDGITEPVWLGRAVAPMVGRLVQGKDRAAWSPVRAALDPRAEGGQYYGPARRTVGAPERATAVASSTDAGNGRWLWAYAERLIAQQGLHRHAG